MPGAENAGADRALTFRHDLPGAGCGLAGAGLHGRSPCQDASPLFQRPMR